MSASQRQSELPLPEPPGADEEPEEDELVSARGLMLGGLLGLLCLAAIAALLWWGFG